MENKSDQFFTVQSTHPCKFNGLAWENNHAKTLMLVNYQPNHITIYLPDPFKNGTVLTIDESNYKLFMYNPDFFDIQIPKCLNADINLPLLGIAIITDE